MLTELFISNLASTTVVHGGVSATTPGTLETITVSESDGIFPVVHRGVERFHFKDRDPECGKELFRCIETDGNRWSVIRGAEGSEAVAHTRGFQIRQVITSEFLQRLGGGSTTELVNAVTVCGADNTGETPSSSAIMDAVRSGPAYLPSGVYQLDQPLNLLPGAVLISFGHVVLRPTSDFLGEAAIELIDGNRSTRVENITLDGSELGAGTDIYGIFAETKSLEAELRNVHVSGFPNSGVIASGSNWMLDRISCTRNFGSGFELNIADSLFFGCRAIGNARYGFIGAYDKQSFFGCLAKGNLIDDYRLQSGKSTDSLCFG